MVVLEFKENNCGYLSYISKCKYNLNLWIIFIKIMILKKILFHGKNITFKKKSVLFNTFWQPNSYSPGSSKDWQFFDNFLEKNITGWDSHKW